jgi:hypothetical protein
VSKYTCVGRLELDVAGKKTENAPKESDPPGAALSTRLAAVVQMLILGLV